MGVAVLLAALPACEEEDVPAAPLVTVGAPGDTASPAPPGPFVGAVSPIDEGTRARMTSSWRPGCPVPIEDLRHLSVRHWGFDGHAREGELVVHADVAEDVLGAFRALYDARFPVDRMELVDVHGGDDDASMAANNTSAFNCRTVGGSTRWSEHAYGRAVDINPVQNPYVSRGGAVSPPAGAAYTDRTVVRPGMVVAGDPVVAAFDAIGWGWGGRWSGSKDHQHFSATGR